MHRKLLEVGLRRALFIREEWLAAHEHEDACRLLYVSDIHLRAARTTRLSQQVLESVRRSSPDVILLGGDLVDRASELGRLTDLIGSMSEHAPVLAIGGNHDQRIGLGRVRQSVIDGGGRWIHQETAIVTHRTRTITVSGPEAAELTNTENSDVRVLCAHNPRIWKSHKDSGYDLILTGHLHGCQIVAFEFRNRLFPGALFYPYCYHRHQLGATHLVVSRGVSDLVPIRWRCPREVVLCFV